MNEEQVFDCTGFNFHNPDDPPRGYIIFDPQSDEENNRLDAMLGATALWQEVIAKQQKQVDPGTDQIGNLTAFTELIPVGYSPTGEIIAVVVQGHMALAEGKLMVDGAWFALRFPPEAEHEVKADLTANLKERQAYLETAIAKLGGAA
jgi:hypothetical protein